jgi:hypothetical protein
MTDYNWNTLGRLGNQMFIHAYGSFLARKNGLEWRCNIKNLTKGINTDLVDGKKLFVSKKITDNDAWFYVNKEISEGTEISGWFQQPELVNNPIYAQHLNNIFKIEKRYNINPNHVFVHIRAGDIEQTGKMLPLEYYDSQLQKLQFCGGSVSSDSPNSPIVKKIMEKYNLGFYNSTPEDTIIFGASHKKMVLSSGSFSFWIGVLSYKDSEIEIMTMNELMEKYGTELTHPNYSLKLVKKYANT